MKYNRHEHELGAAKFRRSVNYASLGYLDELDEDDHYLESEIKSDLDMIFSNKNIIHQSAPRLKYISGNRVFVR